MIDFRCKLIRSSSRILPGQPRRCDYTIELLDCVGRVALSKFEFRTAFLTAVLTDFALLFGVAFRDEFKGKQFAAVQTIAQGSRLKRRIKYAISENYVTHLIAPGFKLDNVQYNRVGTIVH